MEPHEAHRRRPSAAAARRKAARQGRGAARRYQAQAAVGPVILSSANCLLYYRLVSKPPFITVIEQEKHCAPDLGECLFDLRPLHATRRDAASHISEQFILHRGSEDVAGELAEK